MTLRRRCVRLGEARLRRNHRMPQGTVHRLVHDSKVLVGNAQDEPTHRELHVYTPPGWRERQPLPLLRRSHRTLPLRKSL